MEEQGPGREPRAAMSLRPYQAAAIDSARQMIAEKRARGEPGRALIVLPTGCGKTHTALTLIERAMTADPSLRVLWLAHRAELLTQPAQALARQPVTAWMARVAGILDGNRKRFDRRITFASQATIKTSLATYLSHGAPGLIVVDEAHRSAVGGYTKTMQALEDVGARAGQAPDWIGLTATPERNDGISLAPWWGDVPAFTYGITDALADGYLCPPIFIDEQLEVDEDAQTEMAALADLGESDRLGDLLMEQGVVDATVAAMEKHLAKSPQTGKPVPSLVFCASKKQAAATTDALKDAGWRAGLLLGDMNAGPRAALLTDFQHYNVDVIVNVAVLTEGTDLPRCGAIVAARPFSSKPLWIQAVGRGLRLYPGKDACLVVDLAGAHKEHRGILGVAVLGGDKSPEDVARIDALRLPGATYKIAAGRVVRVNGVELSGGDVFLRGLPVFDGRLVGTMPRGQDEGLPVVIIATGQEAQSKEGHTFVKWARFDDAAPGDEVGDAAALALPRVGAEIVREVRTVGAMDLTKERSALHVSWGHARIDGRHVRIAGLDSTPGAPPNIKTEAQIWCVEHGEAGDLPGFLVAVRRIGQALYAGAQPGQVLRLLTGAPVQWETAEALAADYVRQTAKKVNANEKWRAAPADDRDRALLAKLGVSPARIEITRTAGDVYDLRHVRIAERDPHAPALIAWAIAEADRAAAEKLGGAK